jgi:hypothetical protein
MGLLGKGRVEAGSGGVRVQQMKKTFDCFKAGGRLPLD